MANNEQRCKDAMRMLERELKRRARAEKLKPLGVVVVTLAILSFIGDGTYLLTMVGGANDNEAADESTAPVEPAALTATPVSGEKVPMEHFFPLPKTVSYGYPDGGKMSRDIGKLATDNVPATGTVTITPKTNQGDIPMELGRTVSPCGVSVIGRMVKSDYFNDTVYHRTIGGDLNVLQCGDPIGTGTGGPGLKFIGERPVKDSGLDQNTPLVYPRGFITMTNLNNPDANGSQFFLSWVNSQLPPQYTVFGFMTGEDTKMVADIIRSGIESGGTSDGKPVKEVRIEKAGVKQLT